MAKSGLQPLSGPLEPAGLGTDRAWLCPEGLFHDFLELVLWGFHAIVFIDSLYSGFNTGVFLEPSHAYSIYYGGFGWHSD